MPKPLFTKLVAICAIGFFCVLFGCIYSFHTNDQIMLIMSLLIGFCCVIRFIQLLKLIRSKSYLALTGTCTKREASLIGTTQQITFQSEDTEYCFNLEKRVKILQGHHYCLYFKDTKQGKVVSYQDFLGFEELSATE